MGSVGGNNRAKICAESHLSLSLWGARDSRCAQSLHHHHRDVRRAERIFHSNCFRARDSRCASMKRYIFLIMPNDRDLLVRYSSSRTPEEPFALWHLLRPIVPNKFLMLNKFAAGRRGRNSIKAPRFRRKDILARQSDRKTGRFRSGDHRDRRRSTRLSVFPVEAVRDSIGF